MGRQAKLRASRKKKAAPVLIQYTPDWSNCTQDSFAEYIQNCANLGSDMVFLCLTNLENFSRLRCLTQGERYPIPVYIQLNKEEEEANI